MFGCATDTSDGLGGSGGSTSAQTVTATTGTASMTTSTGTGTGSSTSTGMSLCEMDCTQINTGECLKAVCNDGSYPGQIGACVVVPDEGATCDDELFCTTEDKCDADGKCVGAVPNDCGQTAGECKKIACDETSDTCSEVGSYDPNKACTTATALVDCESGSCTNNKCDPPSCTPSNLCESGGFCDAAGGCVGTPKDCSFSPLTECNAVACNPTNGKCEGVPDTTKNGAACSLSGNLCNSGKTCQAGMCQGGTPKDCSTSPVVDDCNTGVCNPANGACVGMPKAVGTICDDAADECNTGACNAMGDCAPVPTPGVSCPSAVDDCNTGTCSAAGVCMGVPVNNGLSCSDHDACTTNDICGAGTCTGSAVSPCTVFYTEQFMDCAGSAWTFGGDWQCGLPTLVGPANNSAGNTIGTVLNGVYHNGQAYNVAMATSPTIHIPAGSPAKLFFYLWLDTEGSTYDGVNLRISQDGGAYNLVGSGASCTAANMCTPITVSKAYNTTLIGSQPAWGGYESASGWQLVQADLASFAGHDINLRFSFRTDGSGVYAGAYIDSVTVAENQNAVPLEIVTTSLPGATVGLGYTANLTRFGGTAGSTWSIVPGGVNDSWLTINPMTGQLTGTPGVGNAGPVTVTVRVDEPSLPANFDQQTYSITVTPPTPIPYTEGFEGACPNGWDLTGDWQCGTPSSVGPATAFAGTKCLATVINGNYSNSLSYATTTATSPAYQLSGANPKVNWKAWVYTETGAYDAYNILISTNGGATWSQLTSVTPAYTGSVDSQQAWYGQNSSWQNYQADLTAFAGQIVKLRFAFRTDSIIVNPGVYIDEVAITPN